MKNYQKEIETLKRGQKLLGWLVALLFIWFSGLFLALTIL